MTKEIMVRRLLTGATICMLALAAAAAAVSDAKVKLALSFLVLALLATVLLPATRRFALRRI